MSSEGVVGTAPTKDAASKAAGIREYLIVIVIDVQTFN